MGAVSSMCNRLDALIQAIKAGNDLIMIKNLFGYEPPLPQRSLYWIRGAIKKSELEGASFTGSQKSAFNIARPQSNAPDHNNLNSKV